MPIQDDLQPAKHFDRKLERAIQSLSSPDFGLFALYTTGGPRGKAGVRPMKIRNSLREWYLSDAVRPDGCWAGLGWVSVRWDMWLVGRLATACPVMLDGDVAFPIYQHLPAPSTPRWESGPNEQGAVALAYRREVVPDLVAFLQVVLYGFLGTMCLY